MVSNLVKRYAEYMTRVAKCDALRVSYEDNPTPTKLQKYLAVSEGLIDLRQSVLGASKDVIVSLSDKYALDPLAHRFRSLAAKRGALNRAAYSKIVTPEAGAKYITMLTSFKQDENKLLHDAMRVISELHKMEQ